MVSTIDVVVRCRNEMPRTRACLEALAVQREPRARVLFVDDGSTDGSRQVAWTMGARVHDVGATEYVPGRILNEAMELTRGPVVAFVNADAVPLHEDALARLVLPLLADRRLCAGYGRQIARLGAVPLTRSDYERTFGAGRPVTRVGWFFSMAAAAIRREVWVTLPFDESLRYSEDVDWTYRAGALGWRVAYVPDACFEKSREYSLRDHYRRRRGEGAADTRIFRLGGPSPFGELLWPLGGAILRDARAGLLSVSELAVRTAQAAGYYDGRRRGW